MGIEFTITKELASISVTATELAAISTLVRGQIGSRDFRGQFDPLLASIAGAYDVVIQLLQPFAALRDAADFNRDFTACHTHYKAVYLKEASRPRLFTEQAFQQYQILKTCRELQTGFPLLKRTFTRLDELIDKWIDNDCWLVMNMDTVFKLLHRLLNEFETMRIKDPDEAWLLYRQAFDGFDPYLAILARHRVALAII
ncbi:MAG TPA: hypothetical protein VFX11_11545 [Candidatus Kapabacteria bacterium]|nr:hypothetical protein [Candidatus Kapabacteria bacterium]